MLVTHQSGGCLGRPVFAVTRMDSGFRTGQTRQQRIDEAALFVG